jgi:hypothetical protein
VTRDPFPFKLVFVSVLAITVGSGLAAVLIAYLWIDPTHNQQAIFDALDFAWKAGIGAIFGLLGGRITVSGMRFHVGRSHASRR